MFTKLNILLITAYCLSACVAIPEVEIPHKMTFDYVIPNQAPMSYADILCCYDCRV